MLSWFSQLMFDKVDCVFIDNGLDLQYKKPNWFLECQKFLILWDTIPKSQAESFLQASGSLNAGLTVFIELKNTN